MASCSSSVRSPVSLLAIHLTEGYSVGMVVRLKADLKHCGAKAPTNRRCILLTQSRATTRSLHLLFSIFCWWRCCTPTGQLCTKGTSTSNSSSSQEVDLKANKQQEARSYLRHQWPANHYPANHQLRDSAGRAFLVRHSR